MRYFLNTIIAVSLLLLPLTNAEGKKYNKPIRINQHITFMVSSIDSTLYIDGIGAIPDYKFNFKKNTAPWARYSNDFRHIVIKNGIYKIGKYSFANISNDQNLSYSVELPNSLRGIDEGAFMNSPITGIDIPSMVSYIGERAFMRTKIDRIHYNGETWTSILKESFLYTNIDSLVIPKSINRICNESFYGKYTYVDLNNASYLEAYAFGFGQGSTIKEIVAKNPKLKLEYRSLGNNWQLQKINIPTSTEVIHNQYTHNIFTANGCDGKSDVEIISFWNMPIKRLRDLEYVERYYGLRKEALIRYIESVPKYLINLADDAIFFHDDQKTIYYCQKIISLKYEVNNWAKYRDKYEEVLYNTEQFDKLDEHLGTNAGRGGYERMGKLDKNYYILGAEKGDFGCINHIVNSSSFDRVVRLKYLERINYSDISYLPLYLKCCNSLQLYKRTLTVGLPEYEKGYNNNQEYIIYLYPEIIRAFNGENKYLEAAKWERNHKNFFSAGQFYEKANNVAMAIKCYKEAKSNKGNKRIGEIYEKGLGVQADLQLARVYYMRAEDTKSTKRIDDILAASSHNSQKTLKMTTAGNNATSSSSRPSSSDKEIKSSNKVNYIAKGVYSIHIEPFPIDAEVVFYKNYITVFGQEYKFDHTEGVYSVYSAPDAFGGRTLYYVDFDYNMKQVQEMWSPYSGTTGYNTTRMTRKGEIYNPNFSNTSVSAGYNKPTGTTSNQHNSKVKEVHHKEQCWNCHGKKKIIKYISVSDLGTWDRKWCSECNDYYTPSTAHIHQDCPTCHGTGYVDKVTYETVTD